MTAAATLMGLGVPDQQARRLGFSVVTKAGVGTAQNGTAVVTTNMTILTTAGGQTAITLPVAIPGSGPVIISNFSATTGLVFPATGETINGGTLNASVNVAQNASRVFFKVSATQWISLLSG